MTPEPCKCCHRTEGHDIDCVPHADCEGKGCEECYGGRCMKDDELDDLEAWAGWLDEDDL